jgi:hypothetical protein
MVYANTPAADFGAPRRAPNFRETQERRRFEALA